MLFSCVVFGMQTLPVCHEHSTIIEFVQCRACFELKEREGNNNNTNNKQKKKPEKPFISFFSSLIQVMCSCSDCLQFSVFWVCLLSLHRCHYYDRRDVGMMVCRVSVLFSSLLFTLYEMPCIRVVTWNTYPNHLQNCILFHEMKIKGIHTHNRTLFYFHSYAQIVNLYNHDLCILHMSQYPVSINQITIIITVVYNGTKVWFHVSGIKCQD